ncbi:hypothetical protein [Chelativorans sp. AA-79]|uniref:hypothetical protein n=1 Tax=Chelativorans sp. AA-79 TaxID=3028735 RepID=UPI0023F8B01E|nr:hypothetical protein [Chelativorans sp. AA-79]WEX10011.1 hypothetical protein PVE73_03320 [Chelativorans sp. AA-79]
MPEITRKFNVLGHMLGFLRQNGPRRFSPARKKSARCSPILASQAFRFTDKDRRNADEPLLPAADILRHPSNGKKKIGRLLHESTIVSKTSPGTDR